MDEVKRGGVEGPVELGVFDLKGQILRHPDWLDGADVCADDLRGRVGVGHVDGPDARSGANVEDFGWPLGDWRLEESVAQE